VRSGGLARSCPRRPARRSVTRRRRVRPVSRLAMARWPLPRPMKAVRGAGKLCAASPTDVRAPTASARNVARASPPRSNADRQSHQRAVLRHDTGPRFPYLDRAFADAGLCGQLALGQPGGMAIFSQPLAKIGLLSTSSGATNGGGLLLVGGVVIVNAAPSQVCHPGSPYRHRAYAAMTGLGR